MRVKVLLELVYPEKNGNVYRNMDCREKRKTMSYPDTLKIEYRCAGCKKKRTFVNTGKFRVNANGNCVDVWLIYQCEKCRHTLNLTIYERTKPSKIPAELYQRFLENDEALAEQYGNDRGFLKKNRVVVDG